MILQQGMKSVVLAFLLVAPAVSQLNLVDSIVKAPVVSNGDVAGEPTDIVINLRISPDPNVPGRALRRGQSVRVIFPEAFVNRNQLPLQSVGSPGCTTPLHVRPSCNTAVFLQGWPQRPVPPARYRLSWEGSNTLVYTALEDIMPAPPTDPGIKQMHLLLFDLVNPAPGWYPITVVAETGPDGHFEVGTGFVQILPKPRPSVNFTSALFAPSGQNAIFQSARIGQEPARPLDVLLWDRDGRPADNVALVPNPDDDPETGPKLLVQGRKVLGFVTVEPPPGATGYQVQAAAPSAAVNSPVSGLPTGHLRMTFRAGSLPGGYLVNVTMIGGNTVQFVVVAN